MTDTRHTHEFSRADFRCPVKDVLDQWMADHHKTHTLNLKEDE